MDLNEHLIPLMIIHCCCLKSYTEVFAYNTLYFSLIVHSNSNTLSALEENNVEEKKKIKQSQQVSVAGHLTHRSKHEDCKPTHTPHVFDLSIAPIIV